MKDKSVISAALIAIGIVILGFCLKAGIDNFVDKDRQVVVKGLSEHEVEANKVTWPIVAHVTGNNLPQLYEQIQAAQQTIKVFLTSNGIVEADITLGAADVSDLETDMWSENKKPYRYVVSANVVVTSTDVAKVGEIISRKGELLREGIAIDDRVPDYSYTSFQEMKPKMMEEAIANAEKTAQQFAENSHSTLNKIVNADQGYFSIEDRDDYTPHIKKMRVVTTITYSLKD
ncbi:MAG: SIMPL domain-containing protein [Bacteroidaceae bacterium]|nr:SIMPL domain-containing protein [Bacteroidaceae bacterium]